jgi:hypothetical protein
MIFMVVQNRKFFLKTGAHMKLLVGFLSLIVSFASIASSGETKSFIYDGSQNSVEMILRGDKTHTEYRTETYTTTCFRTEIVGYRTICHGGPGYPGPGPRPFPGPGPRPFPGPGPRPFPGPGPRPFPNSCWQEPIYRQVAYSCTQTRQIPYEVKDYDVEARVLVDIKNLSNIATSGETFNVALMGDSLTITANGSKTFIIVLKDQDVRSNYTGSVKFLDAFYSVELVEAYPIVNSIRNMKIAFNNPVFSFNLPEAKNLVFSLKAVKNRALASDIVLLDRDLAAAEITTVASSAGVNVAADLARLGVTTEDVKLTLTGTVSYKTPGSILNRSQFGNELSASKIIVYKNR